MSLDIELGDITEYQVDAIVNSVGIDAGVYGRVCKRIVLASKSTILANYLKSKNDNKIGDVFIIENVDNWKLGCKYLINVVTPSQKHNDISIYEAYERCIKKAVDLKCKSIAMPIIGTGANGFNDEYVLKECQSACYKYSNDIDIYIVLYKGVAALTNYRENNNMYDINYGEKLFNYAFVMGEIDKNEMFHSTFKYTNQYDFIIDYKAVKGLTYEKFNEAGIDNKKRNHWSVKEQLKKDEVFLLIFVTDMNKTEAMQFMVHCNYSFNPQRRQDQFMYNYLTIKTKYNTYNEFANAMNKYCHYKVYEII